MQIKRPYRVTMFWQGAATTAIAVVSGLAAGSDAVLSAVLGGAIAGAGVLAVALMSTLRPETTAAALRTMVRAEAVKVVVIVLLLWLALAGYGGLVVLPFFGAFMVSVLLSGIAFAVTDD